MSPSWGLAILVGGTLAIGAFGYWNEQRRHGKTPKRRGR
jgi:hypothetical protein